MFCETRTTAERCHKIINTHMVSYTFFLLCYIGTIHVGILSVIPLNIYLALKNLNEQEKVSFIVINADRRH